MCTTPIVSHFMTCFILIWTDDASPAVEMTRGEKARSAMREAMRSNIISERRHEARTDELKVQCVLTVGRTLWYIAQEQEVGICFQS